jgi:predicted N-acetyltransferase YhbS
MDVAKPIVRDADRSDLADIREVVQAAHSRFEALLPPTVFMRYLDDLLDLEEHFRRGQLLVAEVDGRIRGSAAFYPNTYNQGMGWPRGWAGGRGMAVPPENRHEDAARALLDECERRARAYGARTFAFHAPTFMTDAIALYERLGYCRVAHFDLDMTAHFGLSTSRPVMAIAFRRNLRDSGRCPGDLGTDHRRPTRRLSVARSIATG